MQNSGITKRQSDVNLITIHEFSSKRMLIRMIPFFHLIHASHHLHIEGRWYRVWRKTTNFHLLFNSSHLTSLHQSSHLPPSRFESQQRISLLSPIPSIPLLLLHLSPPSSSRSLNYLEVTYVHNRHQQHTPTCRQLSFPQIPHHQSANKIPTKQSIHRQTHPTSILFPRPPTP